MTTFDRAAIKRIRDDLADLNARCGYASPGLCALAAEQFDACLDEIDQLTSRLEGRGFQKVCETAAANLERAEQAEAQVKRLRDALGKVVDSGRHYAAQQIARAETEGL